MEKPEELLPLCIVSGPADRDAVQRLALEKMRRPVAATTDALMQYVKRLLNLKRFEISDNIIVNIEVVCDRWKWSVERPAVGLGAKGTADSATDCGRLVFEAVDLLEEKVKRRNGK